MDRKKRFQPNESDTDTESSWGSDFPSEYRYSEGSSSDTSSSEGSEEEKIEISTRKFEWDGYDEETSQNIMPTEPDFEASPGINIDLSKLEHPIEFFELFWDDRFVSQICEYTHLFHRNQQQRSHKRRDSHQKQWKKPDTEEMKAFLGLLLFTGIVKKSDVKDYWTESVLFGTPGFARIFSRDHFIAMKRALNFVDEQTADKSDALYKVRPLIDHIISISRKLYTPEQFLTIDECMIRFNGRSHMKVYMPLKPIKYGFKAYILSEASSGYIIGWNLHEGGKNKKKKPKQTQPLRKIVFSLVESYRNQGYVICMDRFYSTISILTELAENGFGCVGAIMRNRLSLTDSMKREIDGLKSHESIFYVTNTALMLTCWKDSKIVHMLSTFGEDYLSPITRNSKDEKGDYVKKEALCPDIIQLYSQNARGGGSFRSNDRIL